MEGLLSMGPTPSSYFYIMVMTNKKTAHTAKEMITNLPFEHDQN